VIYLQSVSEHLLGFWPNMGVVPESFRFRKTTFCVVI